MHTGPGRPTISSGFRCSGWLMQQNLIQQIIITKDKLIKPRCLSHVEHCAFLCYPCQSSTEMVEDTIYQSPQWKQTGQNGGERRSRHLSRQTSQRNDVRGRLTKHTYVAKFYWGICMGGFFCLFLAFGSLSFFSLRFFLPLYIIGVM